MNFLFSDLLLVITNINTRLISADCKLFAASSNICNRKFLDV